MCGERREGGVTEHILVNVEQRLGALPPERHQLVASLYLDIRGPAGEIVEVVVGWW